MRATFEFEVDEGHCTTWYVVMQNNKPLTICPTEKDAKEEVKVHKDIEYAGACDWYRLSEPSFGWRPSRIYYQECHFCSDIFKSIKYDSDF